ncbi:MAG: serine hydrolase [Candidatus Paceibacterota bacterium]
MLRTNSNLVGSFLKDHPLSFSVVSLLLSFALGFFASNNGIIPHIVSSYDVAKPFREKTASKYVSPLLFCSESTPSLEDKDLTQKLSKLVDVRIQDGTIDNASIYVRALTTGEWSGVNEDDKYSPASLMKVAVMLAYFKEAESNPGLLSEVIHYGGIDKDANSLENIKPEKSIQKDHQYTIDELIEYVIKYSDNNAALALNTLADKALFNEIYVDLGLPMPPTSSNPGTADYMSVKLFSRFFRVFYNATYLNTEFSEKAIKLLLEAKFPGGIASGVPKGTEIASKFGERTIVSGDGAVTSRELHDCGIVYAKDNPYLLCIMTKGGDLTKLSGVIREISTLVYKNIVSD